MVSSLVQLPEGAFADGLNLYTLDLSGCPGALTPGTDLSQLTNLKQLKVA